MAKTITVTDDAYRRLLRLKRAKESFSEVIQRLTGREDLVRFFGAISEEFGDELDAESSRARRELGRSLERRSD